MAEQWEYYAPRCDWDKSTNQWKIENKTSPSIGALLNTYGAAGWELVAFTAENWAPTYFQGVAAAGGDVAQFRVVFKRRKP